MVVSRACVLVVFAMLATTGSSRAQGVQYTLVGPDGGDMGPVVATADLDGDGARDILATEYVGGAFVVDLRSGRTGALVHEFVAPAGVYGFGMSSCGQGDVNGDGAPDVLIGSPYEGSASAGAIYVYSGSDFSLIRKHTGVGAAELGHFVAILGDVDVDGCDEYAASSDIYNPYFETESGSVDVFAGADGHKLTTFKGDDDTDFGRSVLGLGDVTGDGVPDLAISEPGASSGGWTANGVIHTYSGATWAVATQLAPATSYSYSGVAMDALGDIDGDGCGDIVCPAATLDADGWISGALLGSPATGSVLATISGSLPHAAYIAGQTIAALPDVNGDGKDDVMFVDGDDDHGQVITAGSASGQPVFVTEPPIQSGFPSLLTVAALGDTDGDGYPEFVVSDALAVPPGGQENGMLWVYTTRPLLAAPDTLEVAAPGTVEFTLSPGVGHAGATYVLLASVTPESGACGGIDVGMAHVPYCRDAAMAASLMLANSPVFQSSVGVLDGLTGQGSAKLDATGSHITGAAIGVVLDFFFVTKPVGGTWDKAWPAAQVEIVP